MDKIYAVFMGGSGARCATAMAWLTATGLFNKHREIHILLADAHKGHKDRNNAKNVIQQYGSLREAINPQGRFTLCRPEIFLYNWNITPSNSSLGNLDQLTLERFAKMDLNGTPAADRQGVDLLLDTLYTQREKDIMVPEGYRGHPSVGAAFSTGSILYNKQREKTLVEEEAKKEMGDYQLFCDSLRHSLSMGDASVFLVGSLFGGTGAACMSSLSRDIRGVGDAVLQGSSSKALTVHGVFLAPYFSFRPKPNMDENAIDPDSFPNAAKTALEYYNKTGLLKDGYSSDAVFDSVYVLGYAKREANTDYDESDLQSHAPHLIELEAAMAIYHGMDQPVRDRKNTLYKSVKYGVHPEENAYHYMIDWDCVSYGPQKLRKAVGNLVLLAVMYNTYWLPEVVDSSGMLRDKVSGTLLHDYIRKMGNDQLVADVMSKTAGFFAQYLAWCYDFASSIEGGRFTRLFDLQLLQKWLSATPGKAGVKAGELSALRSDIERMVYSIGKKSAKNIFRAANTDSRMEKEKNIQDCPGLFVEILLDAVRGMEV